VCVCVCLHHVTALGRYVEYIKQTVASLPKPEPGAVKKGSKKSRRLRVELEASDAQVNATSPHVCCVVCGGGGL
jgi:hypothetical protein